MVKKLLFILIAIEIYGCQPARSDIFEERMSPQLVQQLISKADSIAPLIPEDSIYKDWPPMWVNGQKLFFYEDGKTSALWFDEQGTLTGLVERKGFITTDSIAFYQNGQRIFSILLNKDGKPSGPARYYYPDGRVKGDGRFENGIKTGIWRNFREDGKLEFTEEYDRYGKKRR